MSRVVYDSSKYYEEKAKLPKADGIHCITCGKPFDKPDKRKSYCTPACFSKWYDSLAVNSWSRIKFQVLERDGKCLQCGVKIGTANPEWQKGSSIIKRCHREVVFEVHHVKPICEGGKEFDPNNCITLCYDCHREKHTIIGKQKRFNHSLEEFIHA